MIAAPVASLPAPRAMPAFYRHQGRTEEHATVAITALAMRAMRRSGQGHPAELAAHAAFLLAAMDADGSFGFWPHAGRPPWARSVPRDTDDTALALLELYLAGLVERKAAVRTVARLLLPQRVRPGGPARPAWIAAGAFETWLVPSGTPRRPNPVDCAANANIVALLAALGMQDCPGRAAACRSIAAGLDWASGDPLRLRSLAPFYPQVWDLHDAVRNAAECGARELAPLAARLAQLQPPLPGPDSPVCSAAYRSDGWTSPELRKLSGKVRE
jgi:hypothetical protein